MSTANGEKVIVIDIALDEDNNLQKVTEDAITEVGFIKPYAGTSVPTGYLLCNGAAISRAQYPELFAAIGTTWGAGDGSSTFNVPDLRGYFLRGVGGGQAAALGAAQTEAVNWERLQFAMQRGRNTDMTTLDELVATGNINMININGGNNLFPFNGNLSKTMSAYGYDADRNLVYKDGDPWQSVGSDGTVFAPNKDIFKYRDTETRPMNKAVNYCIRYA